MGGRSIPGLKKYQGRNPMGYFDNLPWPVQQRAYAWLGYFCKRWGSNLPGWRFAILVGQANRLALNPPTSEWGRSMLGKRGGHAVQDRYRWEGRHPTENATRARLAKAELKQRKELGLPPATRHRFLPLG